MSLEVHQKSRSGPQKISFYSLGWPTENQSTLAGLPTSRCMKKAPFTITHQMNMHKNHVLCLSKSIKKSRSGPQKISFYSLGWPTENQSTLAGLPTGRCITKDPFTMTHQMNEHKNHVLCLSKSIKKADQDRKKSKNHYFIISASQLRTSRHLAGLPASMCTKKSSIDNNTSNE